MVAGSVCTYANSYTHPLPHFRGDYQDMRDYEGFYANHVWSPAHSSGGNTLQRLKCALGPPSHYLGPGGWALCPSENVCE